MSAFTALRRASAFRPDAAGTAEPQPGGADTALSAENYGGPPEPGRAVRRLIILAIIAYSLLVPAVNAIMHRVTPASVFLVAGSLVFIPLVVIVAVGPATRHSAKVPWAWLLLIAALGISLFEVGGGGWLTVLAVTAGACGRFTTSVWPATFGAIAGSAAGLIMAVRGHAPEGDVATALIMPPLAAFFAYSAGTRMEMVATLGRTRAELARIAVAEERLRIARDLHDLLGHSLSLITLKAELARRMIPADPDRAAREIAELEAVSRQSLSDVREAVAGYRQPDLAAELAAARQLLTAAGIACQITTPDKIALPSDVDAVLAWTVREGVTNVVRHAAARSARITVSADASAAVAEIRDDGTGTPPGQPAATTAATMLPPGQPALSKPAPGQPAPGQPASGRPEDGTAMAPERGPARLKLAGSGLAGLAERVRELGGDLAAGRATPSGFRLRVTIPLAGQES